jgi:glutathione peroxidase
MSIHTFSVTTMTGSQFALDAYKGKVVVIVNTASQCGLTPQYRELETMHEELKELGGVVLGFPCNQFGHQEPLDATEIQSFCEKNFGISFPLFAKINVNGKDASPLYRYLRQQAPGILGSTSIKWNFTKFLIKKDGSVYRRYAPTTKPHDLMADIRLLLQETEAN